VIVLISDQLPTAIDSLLSNLGYISMRSPLILGACRFMSCNAWSLIGYELVVWLDSETMVISSIDELFHRSPLSAVPDFRVPDQFDTGVMVLQPNIDTFARLIEHFQESSSPPHDNMTDQQVLNRFFSDWSLSESRKRLPAIYNLAIKDTLTSDERSMNAKVLHFVGAFRPWNMAYRGPMWPSGMEYRRIWWMHHDHTISKLNGVLKSTAPAVQAIISTELQLDHWMKTECKYDYSQALVNPKQNSLPWEKYTIVMNVFNRFSLLKKHLQHYATAPSLQNIFVVWGNQGLKASLDFMDLDKNTLDKVILLNYHRDNLNDRFRPIQQLSTFCVVIIDDDILVSVESLESAFLEWKENPFRVMGYFPRSHAPGVNPGTLEYVFRPKQQYSMVLTKLMFIHAEYLKHYTCDMPQSIRDYVSVHRNCEDIAFNFMASFVNNGPPMYYLDLSKEDWGISTGISANTQVHAPSRSACLSEFASVFRVFPLKLTSDVAARFVDDNYVQKSPKKEDQATELLQSTDSHAQASWPEQKAKVSILSDDIRAQTTPPQPKLVVLGEQDKSPQGSISKEINSETVSVTAQGNSQSLHDTRPPSSRSHRIIDTGATHKHRSKLWQDFQGGY
jgi:hypothetical protein